LFQNSFFSWKPLNKQSNQKRNEINMVSTKILRDFQERPEKTCTFQNMFVYMKTCE